MCSKLQMCCVGLQNYSKRLAICTYIYFYMYMKTGPLRLIDVVKPRMHYCYVT
jgi:hypothetical protein